MMTKATIESVNETCIDLFEKKKIRILHADNDAEFLAVAKQCLEEQNQFQVDTALSAEEALEKLRNSEYDAIVADYHMPGKNGLELLKELRKEGKNVPFILFTCKSKEEVAIEAVNSGVEQYIDKQGNAETTYEILKQSICNAVKRQRTEKRLKESENLLSQITDNMQDMLSLTDVNLVFTYASSSHKWILGYQPNEMIGKPIHQYIHPDDLATAMEVIQKAAEKRSGEKMEVRVKHADGHYLLLEIRGKALINENGQINGAVFNSRDITEQKWMQEVLGEAIAKVAELNEKLRVVESLTRHDLRNKLSALNGLVYILKKRCRENQEAQQQLREIELVAQQMLRILEFERIYSQVGAEELDYINMEQHLSEAISLFSDVKGVKLINDCHGLTVFADSLLRQLFYNLIDNSLKYGEKTSKIRVHYEVEKDQAKLIYDDDGVGIAEEIRGNLFKEGFGKGTGYGLYLIKRICEAYGWTIAETGKQGQGVQFTMVIPKKGKDGKGNYEIS
jgi:PAS domain S-box-containing protein